MIRPHFDVVGPITIVELRVPHAQTAGKSSIALRGPLVPPTTGFPRMTRIAKVDDDVDLVILRIRGVKVRHAGRQVGELAVYEPQTMDASRMWPRGIEERELD